MKILELLLKLVIESELSKIQYMTSPNINVSIYWKHNFIW